VVVVPSYTATLPGPAEPNAWPLTLIDWVRSGWQNSRWVDVRPAGTAIAGHSYGALFAGRLVNARPTFGAFVSLSGPWGELHGTALSIVGGLRCPSFFMSSASPLEDINAAGVWGAAVDPKYAASFGGEHFDYIDDAPECNEARGVCDLMASAAADLVALFITRYVRIPLAQVRVPIDLNPAPSRLTAAQQPFASDHLNFEGRLAGLASFDGDSRCTIDLQWVASGVSGRRTIRRMA
jgi:pimeloyl-ACP methyl ester carboxylesterase